MSKTARKDKASPEKKQSSVLLEIGTEEIPSRFLPGAIKDIAEIVSRLFDEYRLEHRDIRSFATPRRISVIAGAVSGRQQDLVKEVFGPSRAAAFDGQGNPTKAALGFASSVGIPVTSLKTRKKGKGDYVVAVIEEKGADTASVLPEILKKAVLALRFPKSMRWGNGTLTFVRPIQWILALYGTQKIDFEVGGIRSSSMTRGHRFLSPAAFQIKDIESYVRLMENNYVILDHEKRKEAIRKGILSHFNAAETQPVIDEELLETVNFLVEYPVPVLCHFGREYLRLPKELLMTVMKDHQKYFAVEDGNGNLVNNFVVVSNTRRENGETVRIGAERVIKARFDDAAFYFEEDTSKPLISRLEQLRGVTFHDKLGTLYDKSERILFIVNFLAMGIGSDGTESMIRAARLAKTDLLTGVVREFPELQGIMGKYYAMHDGEDRGVAEALEEQYLPKFLGDRLPRSDAGAVLSIADKIDNIASFFAIGQTPTGSEDPFALRRQAMGVVSIILERKLPLTLREIIKAALENVSNNQDIEISSDILDGIVAFVTQRLEFILTSRGYDHELTGSVLGLAPDYPLQSIVSRLDALAGFRKETIFSEFLLAIKRVHNILPKGPVPDLQQDLLAEIEEKHLFSSFMAVRDRCLSLIEENMFHEGLKTFSSITPQINNFFDNVLVMDKRDEVRLNRLALLNELKAVSSLFADFSKFQS